MNAFRVLAAAYALTVLLIAPAWLAADEVSSTAPAAPAQEPASAPATDPAATVEPAAAPAAPADEAPVATAQAAADPATEAKPAAAAAKDEKADDEPVAHVAGAASVTISDFKFSPSTVTVNVGDTVTWTNDGPTVHSAKANDGSFDTGLLDKGESGSHTFSSAGTISYICEPHPFMKAKVVVQGTSAGSGGSDSGDTAGEGGSTDSTDTTSADDSGLPNTGGETLAIALLGLATLGTGLLLRRREHARD